ncbi:MAG: glycerophosphodiester phosphodiesterase [Gammaproteobacteria bacterium]|nr:glycerophosphodiester phosphodiesterase [Gammaproteobacteria bacterium]
MKSPTLIAHRGYAARYPENTLQALQAAVQAGARWLEFDVQLSADKIPVLLHDTTLDRTAGRPGSLFDITAQQLSAIGVGEPARFGTRFAEVVLPTLAEVVAWLTTQPNVQAFVEIKTESIQRFGVEAVHEAVMRVLEPVRERCVLISYDDAFLFAARLATPLRIGWVAAEWSDDSARRARALAPDFLFTNHTRLPPEPQPLWPGPWQWVVYEVTDSVQALALAARGIAFVESMAVGELLADARLQDRSERG